jgi:hypothetical protein
MAGTRWSTSFADLAAAELKRDRTEAPRAKMRTSASQPITGGTSETPTAREWLLDPKDGALRRGSLPRAWLTCNRPEWSGAGERCGAGPSGARARSPM